MSDEELRGLEREVETGGPEARLRYVEALRRVGRRGEAMQILSPLLLEAAPLGDVAAIRAAALYFDDGDQDGALRVLQGEKHAFSEGIRGEFARIAPKLEELLDVREDGRTGAAHHYGVQAATAIGKLGPLDEVVRIFGKLPARRTHPWAIRHTLAMWIQRRDRSAATALAEAEPDPEVAALLRARGTLIF